MFDHARVTPDIIPKLNIIIDDFCVIAHDAFNRMKLLQLFEIYMLCSQETFFELFFLSNG